MDSLAARIRAYCLSKQAAFEDHPWGETVFKVGPSGRVFCFAEDQAITVKATLHEQAALVQHPNIEVAKYVGRYGWVTVHMRDEDTTDFAFELIDRSYDRVVRSRVSRS